MVYHIYHLVYHVHVTVMTSVVEGWQQNIVLSSFRGIWELSSDTKQGLGDREDFSLDRMCRILVRVFLGD